MSSAVFCRNNVGIDDYYCDLLGYRMWFNILTGDALRKPNSCVGTTLLRAERRTFSCLSFWVSAISTLLRTMVLP